MSKASSSRNGTVQTVNPELAPSVVMSFRILDALADMGQALTLTEIANIADVPKSTSHRLLATLTAIGAVERRTTGRYTLGPKLANYLGTYDEYDIVQDFHEISRELRLKFDETVQLGVLTGTDVTFVAFVDSSKPVRLMTRVGRRLPAHASAVGKAILAFSPDDVVDAVVDAGLPKVTERTLTSERDFRHALALVRDQGYATETEENTPNLSCIAAPLFGAQGQVVAGITMCVPTVTIPQARQELLAKHVVEAARAMSRRSRSIEVFAPELGAQ